jgi:hypothetical protein
MTLYYYIIKIHQHKEMCKGNDEETERCRSSQRFDSCSYDGSQSVAFGRSRSRSIDFGRIQRYLKSIYVGMYARRYERMDVPMYLCIYVPMNVCTFELMNVSLYLCMNVHMYECTYVSMYQCIYVCIFVSMYKCMNECMYLCIYV